MVPAAKDERSKDWTYSRSSRSGGGCRSSLFDFIFSFFRLSLLLAVALTLQNGWTLKTVQWISSNSIIVFLYLIVDRKPTNLKAFIRRGVGVVCKLTNAIMGGRRLSCYLLVFLIYSFAFVMT